MKILPAKFRVISEKSYWDLQQNFLELCKLQYPEHWNVEEFPFASPPDDRFSLCLLLIGTP